MKINVIGLGYIGLPTSLVMAQSGLNIVGTDYNKELVDSLQNGKITFEEDGLQEAYDKATANGMTFSHEYLPDADFYIVAVPTPYDPVSKKIDPSYIQAAVKEIAKVGTEPTVVVIESTVSPGTLDKYVRPLIKSAERQMELVHAPERIIPGSMFRELIENSRTVGADSEEVAIMVRDIYKSFCKGDIVLTDIHTAEMTKVVENTYRDVNIAFANELARICNEAGLDVNEVIRISNMHPRVNILSPGPGVGGHCISVDPWFLVGDYPELTKLIKISRDINDSQPFYVWEKVKVYMKENNIHDFSKVGIYGITYKENVDDTREAPTLQLIEGLNQELEAVRVYDPMVKKQVLSNQIMDFNDFLRDLELLVVFVSHDHLSNITIPENTSVLSAKNLKNLKFISIFDIR